VPPLYTLLMHPGRHFLKPQIHSHSVAETGVTFEGAA
jgi:hypothetical protein